MVVGFTGMDKEELCPSQSCTEMDESALSSSELPITGGVQAKASDTFRLLDWRTLKVPSDSDILCADV